MAYTCFNCGEIISAEADYCLNCGAPTKRPSAKPVETGTGKWGVLGFFIPVVGIILWVLWMDERPKAAKTAGIWALIGIISSVILTIILWAVWIALAISFDNNFLMI